MVVRINLVGGTMRVLLLNGSKEEAYGVMPWLEQHIPNCKLSLVPSIELAMWLLDRQPFELIVSSQLLPDGSFERMMHKLKKLKPPPALIVIGTEKHRYEVMKSDAYRLASLTPVDTARGERGGTTMQEVVTTAREYHLKKRISHLGADLRNDLNNPLQEIVAMAFVASAFLGSNEGQVVSEETDKAIRAINQAAQGMAQVVNSLEQKIRLTLDHTLVQEL
jgi:hypothetical protein